MVVLACAATTAYVVANHLFKTNPSAARTVNAPMPVRVVLVKEDTLTEVLGATGEVQPIALVDLTATTPTRVERVAVDLGDEVSPGRELIRFDHELLIAAQMTARTALDQAGGELDRATQYARRIGTIYEQNLLPKIDLEKAQAAVDEAKTRRSGAQEKHLRAEKDLENATLVSPVQGVVMERAINEGETPKLGQKLLTIGRIDEVVIEAKMAEERVGDVQHRQAAEVTFNAYPNDVFTGEVARIKPVTDPQTRTFLVYVKLANPDLKLKPGLTGFIRIKREHRTLAVPSVALISPTGVRESTVFVVDPGSTATLRRVKVGIVAEGKTEVLAGLAAGDRVVAVGQLNLRDGDLVRIGDEFNDVGPTLSGDPHVGSVAEAKPL